MFNLRPLTPSERHRSDEYRRPLSIARSLLLLIGCALLAQFPVGVEAAIGSGQFVEARVDDVPVIDQPGETWGASWGDYNGDGNPDLWLGMHQYSPTAFYHNNGDGTFTNVIETAFADADAHYQDDTHGAAWADFDNDGDQDLIEVCGAGAGKGATSTPIQAEWRNNLFINSGGLLSEGAQGLGVDNPRARTRTPLWLDFNLDGDLDLFTAAVQSSPDQYPSAIFRQASPGFVEASVETGFTPVSCYYAMQTHLGGNGERTLLCADTSRIQAVYDISASPFRELKLEIGNAIYNASPYDLAIADFDGDLDFDVFSGVAPPSSSSAVRTGPDSDRIHAFIAPATTERGFSFTAPGDVLVDFGWDTERGDIYLGANAVAPPADSDVGLRGPDVHPHHVQLILSSSNPDLAGMAANRTAGIYLGYVGGVWEVRVVNAGSNVDVVAKASGISAPTAAPSGSITLGQGSASVPQLFENLDGALVLRTTADIFPGVPSVSIQTYARSVVSGDFDNDMDVDLYVGSSSRIANVANLMLDNQGNGTFLPVANGGGAVGHQLGRTDTATLVDYDLDGFLDLFVTQGAFPAPFSYPAEQQLFRNQGNGNHWVLVDLEGVTSNRDGIGALIYATTPDGKVQVREQANGMHRYSQNYQQIHFGLGMNTTVDLEVVWPSGVVDRLSALPVDRIYPFREGAGDGGSYVLSARNVNVRESDDQALFSFTLAPIPGSGEQVAVAYQTRDVSAKAGTDYTAVADTLIFGAGESEKSISVPILADVTPEGTETFSLELSSTVTTTVTVTATISDDDSGATQPQCGAPTYNSATEAALFIWNDCGTNVWHVRATAGGQSLTYRGSLTSDQPFTSMTGFSLENGDALPPNFVMAVGSTGYDGFDFGLQPGATASLTLDSPGGIPVLAGANRIPFASPINLPDFGGVIVIPPSDPAGNWGLWGYDLRNSRFNTAEATLNIDTVADLEPLWKTSIGAVGWSSPALVDGIVYGANWGNTSGAKVYALNANTGSYLWTTPLASGTECTVSVSNGRVYVGTGAGEVKALDAVDGATIWTATTGRGQSVWSSPQVVNGRVFVGSLDGYAYAFDEATGQRIWERQTGGGIRSTAAVVGDIVYFSSFDKSVYALNAADGSVIWKRETGNMARSSPAVVDGVLYIGADSGKLFALNATNGNVIWQTAPAGGALWSSPAVAYGRVYVGSLDHSLYAYEAATGALAWKTELDYRIHASPAVANGVVYAATDEGEALDQDARGGFKVYALDVSSGAVLWSSNACQGPNGVGIDANVVISNGTVVAENEDGYSCAFRAPVSGTLPTLSIEDVTVDEGAGSASFTVSLSAANPSGASVDYATVDGSATAGADYGAIATTTLSFAPGETTQQIVVAILEDSAFGEGAETFSVALSNPVGASLADTAAVGTITDNDTLACGQPAYNTAQEQAVFLWKNCTDGHWYARMTAGGGTVTYQGTIVSDQSFTSVAGYSIESSDMLNYTSDPRVIAYRLTTSATYEDGFAFRGPTDQGVCFTLSTPSTLPVYVGAARTRIDSPFDLATLGPCSTTAVPTASIADVVVNEGGGAAVLTVSLSAANPAGVDLTYSTTNGTAVAGADYTGIAPATLSFGPGETTKQILVPVIDDTVFAEGDETFTVTLSNATGATIADGIGQVTIRDNDNVPTLSVADVMVNEGVGTASVMLTLSSATSLTVTVDAASTNGTATAPADYGSVSAERITFSPGETTKVLPVGIIDDTPAEGSETFTLTLSNPGNALLGNASATVTIIDNDLYACGAPTYDSWEDQAVFLWKGCSDGVWHVRVTAGGEAVTYQGSVVGREPLLSVSPYSVETNDTLDFVTDPKVIVYEFVTRGAYQDGFDFTTATDSGVCFTLTAPASVPVYVGATRAKITSPFDLASLAACTQP